MSRRCSVSEALLELPSDLGDGDALADWAEAVMLLEEREYFPFAELEQRLGESSDATLAASLLMEQVRVRRRRAAKAYPFEREATGIRRRGDVDSTLYEFLLWLALPQSPVRQKREYRPIDRYFDRVVLKALRRYLGSRARGVRFGTPASDGRPTGFRDALYWLADQMGIDRTGALPPNVKKNDAGVDVAVWLRLNDERPDFLVAIAQCTVQAAWEDKARLLHADADLWGGGWLPIGRPPVTALAIPFVVTGTEDRYSELRRLITLILDRTRLCYLAETPYPEDIDALRRWTAIVRAMMMTGDGAEVTTGGPK
jgi:hypothetical protein